MKKILAALLAAVMVLSLCSCATAEETVALRVWVGDNADLPWINSVIENFKAAHPEKTYDRMGVETHYMSILGVKVPCSTIPVKPGRNLAVILEVAAMNNRQKKMGYNAAQELLDNLGLETEHKETVKKWDIY